jgi:hypothetical protein
MTFVALCPQETSPCAKISNDSSHVDIAAATKIAATWFGWEVSMDEIITVFSCSFIKPRR